MPSPIPRVEERLPLFLLLEWSAPRHWIDACERAADEWGVRFAIFGGVQDLPFSDTSGVVAIHVHPTLDPIAGVDIWGHVDLVYGRLGHPIPTIQLSDETPENRRVRVCAHEIGHAMGLAHVDDPLSIMFKFASETPYIIPSTLAGLPLLPSFSLAKP